MSEIQDLLKLARDCYARARVTVNPATKRELTQMGDAHKSEAEGLQRALISHEGETMTGVRAAEIIGNGRDGVPNVHGHPL